MKKIILFLILVSIFSFDSQAQSLTKAQQRAFDTWIFGIGVNAVGSLGTQNPLERLDEFEFNRPFGVSVQHKWSNFLSIEQDFTMNRFKITSRIDNGTLPEEFNYFSTNTYLKYYFSDELFPQTLWLDMYAGTGLGIFSINEFNTSANLVLGGIIWVSDNIGISLQCVGKFAFHHKDNRFDNNHFQYMLYGVFKL